VKEEIVLKGLRLLPEKAVFLESAAMLIIADLHFGKINHFRQAGMPVPPSANVRNAETLIDLINHTRARRVVFLGDLFHSHYNDEWEVLGQLIANFPGSAFELVRGNHDIMSARQYERKGIAVVDEIMVESWLLTHEPLVRTDIPEGLINMAGHLHPGARLQGRGKQGLLLPCFWFSAQQVILPAFGSFTGLYSITPGESDQVWVIAEKKVMRVMLAPISKKTRLAR
jgi:uncharacterized protein